MENENQIQNNVEEEAINGFVIKKVRKSQREEIAAFLRRMNEKKLLELFEEAFRKACEKEMTVM